MTQRKTITMRFQVHSDELPNLYSMLESLPDGKLSRRNALLMRLETMLAGRSQPSDSAEGVARANPVSTPEQAPMPSVTPKSAEPDLPRVELDPADLDEIFGKQSAAA